MLASDAVHCVEKTIVKEILESCGHTKKMKGPILRRRA